MGNQVPLALRRSAATVWSCILAAVALVAVSGAGIAVYDVRRAVEDRREEEFRRLKFNAERTAGQIQTELGDVTSPTGLEMIREARWLRNYWSRNLSRQPERLYAAVTDRESTIVAHSRRDREEKRVALPPYGDGGSLTEIAAIEITDDVLSMGRRAIDMRVPIFSNGVPLGIYHAGLDADWLQSRLAEERSTRSWFWCMLVGGMCGMLLLSSVAVVRVTRHTAHLEHQLEAAHARRVSEMHELVLGIAHEIRNPLNAIRLNLHTLGHVFRDEASLGDDEIATMFDEMTDEVERLENLMREMLGFARTHRDEKAATDVADEIQRTLAFLKANLERQRIQVSVNLPDSHCAVAMDGTRLRQVLLNLLNNAIEALGDGGLIEVGVRCIRGQVEISVADDGPGIAPQDRERVFVPFFSTKASGTGLGLALARKFVEEAGGTIVCEEGPLRGGCRFRVTLPVSSLAALEAVS
jgi:signal transduction histidine kinase